MLTLREANHNDEKFVNEITRKTMCQYVEEAWPDEYNREKYYKDNSFKIKNTKIVCKDEIPVGV